MKALSLSLPTVSLPTAVTIISISTSLLSPHAHPGSFPTLPHCQYHCCYGVVGFGGPIPSLTSQRVDCLATCFWANCERAVGRLAGWTKQGHARSAASTAPQHGYSGRGGIHLGRWAPNTFYKYKNKCSTRTSVLGSGAGGRGGRSGARAGVSHKPLLVYQPKTNKSSWICIATGLPPRAPYPWKKILL